MTNHGRNGNSPVFESLESRLLLSADGVVSGNLEGLYAGIQYPHANMTNMAPNAAAVFVQGYAQIPDYDWWYGCAPTAVGMLAAYYDTRAAGDAVIFPGGDPSNYQWGQYPDWNPIINSEVFSVPDYSNGVVSGWAHQQEASYQIVNGWLEDTWEGHLPDSISDFLLTFSVFGGGEDGYVPGGHDRVLVTTPVDHLAQGAADFFAWDDLRTLEDESWYVQTDYQSVSDPQELFNFADYCAEIDANRPVVLDLTSNLPHDEVTNDHMVLGVGYWLNEDSGKQWIEVLTTWNRGVQQWEWAEINEEGDPLVNNSGYGFTIRGGLVTTIPTQAPGLRGYVSIHVPTSGAVVSARIDLQGTGWSGVPLSFSSPVPTEYTGDINYIKTDIDLSSALPYLSQSEDWVLTVDSDFDGDIVDFQILYDHHDYRWFSPDREKPIVAGQTTRAYVTSGVMGEFNGTVWEDSDGDGVFDAGESGVPGVSVFLDVNEDGVQNFTDWTFDKTDGSSTHNMSTTVSFIHAAGITGTIADVNITLDIAHTYDSDLTVWVREPGQTQLTLFSGVGGDGDDFSITILDDEASESISAGTAPFNGSYRPTGSLSAFDGLDPNGAWTLGIFDALGDTAIGTLRSWSITISTSEPSDTTDANGDYQLQEIPLGWYMVGVTPPTGWVQTAPRGGVYQGFLEGQALQNIDFGIVQPANVSGLVWSDLNGDGTKDGGEPVLDNWTVFLDQNQNGLLDEDETSVTSDLLGQYEFEDLLPGTYYVREEMQNGWVQTTPGGAYTVALVSGVDATDRNFGNRLPALPDLVDTGNDYSSFTPGIGVPGSPWTATWRIDNTGAADAGEFKVAYYASLDQTISAIEDYYLGSATVSGATALGYVNVTLTQGSFPTIPVGTYYVGVIIDSDDQVVEGVAGETNNTGVHNPDPAELLTVSGVSGLVWYDNNNDSVKDAGETLLTGWTVYLDQNNNTQLDGGERSAVTDANGEYYFAGMSIGTYFVRQVVQDGWTQTLPDPAVGSYPITLTAQQLIVENAIFGNYRADLPNLLDAGDLVSGFSPSSVIAPGGVLNVFWDIRNGGNAPSGPFRVDFYATDDNDLGTTEDNYFLGSKNVSGINPGADRDVNLLDVSLPEIPAGNYYLAVIIDPDNQVIESDETDNTAVDNPTDSSGPFEVRNVPELNVTGVAGSGFQQTTVSPGDKWDAWFEIANTGLADATSFIVSFYASDNTTITTFDYLLDWVVVPSLGAGQTTEVSLSLFRFPDIPAGDYYVGVNVDSFWQITEFDETNNKAVDDTYPLCVPGIRGTKWHDLDFDETMDPGEPPLPGFMLYIDLNDSGAYDFVDIDQQGDFDYGTDYWEPYTFSDADGLYSFTGLGAGTFSVAEVPRSGWNRSYPPDADPKHSVTLGAQDLVAGKDFGNARPSKIGLCVFFDNNGDGVHVYSEGDFPTTNRPISMFLDEDGDGVKDPGEQEWTEVTITDTGIIFYGSYTFTDLLPGRYITDTELALWTVETTPQLGKFTNEITSTVLYGANDFGWAYSAAINGKKWEDKNGDRLKNPGEPGLEGWTIYIDVDYDPVVMQSVFDPDNDPWTTTDGSGDYEFTGLLPGTYYVAEVLQDGWAQSWPYTQGYDQTVWEYQLMSGEVATTAHFGNYIPGQIHGTVWHDTDGDGVFKTATEPGLEGWTVELRNDADADGIYDPGEGVVATTTSATDGTYSFVDLVPGDYLVMEQVQLPWRQSAPGENFAGQRIYSILIESRVVATDRDFGNYEPGQISGYKFADTNGDGVSDVGEPGLEGWRIYLDQNENGSLDHGEVYVDTDATGHYDFLDLIPGTYKVTEVVQAGWIQTLPAAGASHEIVLQSGDIITDILFGNFGLGSISGAKWHDLNADGVRDGGEPGLVNWTIYVDANSNGQFDSDTDPYDTTAADGTYIISDLEAGTHTVTEVLQDGWEQSLPQSGDYQVTITSGLSVGGRDFGNYQLGRISGTKWHDLDGDGQWDVGEPGLQGWTIYLDQNANGQLDQGETSATTDTNGDYSLEDLVPDDYAVTEVLPSGWVSTSPSTGVHQVALSSGQVVENLDFFNVEEAKITGYKWHDVDGDGQMDGGESGLQGWTISTGLDVNGDGVLDAGESADLITTTTAANGSYTFTGLLPGDYIVAEFPQDGWSLIYPGAGAHQVTVASGDVAEDVNFGNAQPGTISGVKWQDMDADGVHDITEPLLEGWTIFLDQNQNGQLDGGESYVVTDQNGDYAFTDVLPRPEPYVVSEVLQGGWAQSVPAGGSHDVVITSGLDVSGMDFGNYEPGEVSGIKWHDLDADGVRDPGETGLTNWPIYLDMNENGQFDPSEPVDLTAADGSYSFNNLVLETTYVVAEVVPSGWGQSYPEAPGTVSITPSYSTQRQFEHVDFGNYRCVTIQGRKWHDWNHDAAAAGELGLPGWTIYVDDNDNGALDPGETSATTDAFGYYSFTDLQPATYTIREVSQDGWVQTYPAVPTHSVTLLSGNSATDVDFGNERVPLIIDIAVSTNEDTPILSAVAGMDPEQDNMKFSVVSSPSHGTVQLGPGAGFTYTPDDDFNGTDTFTYTASDYTSDPDDTYGDAAPSTVTVTVNPANDAPVANDVAGTTNEDQAVAIQLDVTDVETASAQHTYTIVTNPSHGTVIPMGLGLYRYRPESNYNGADSFQYTATDRGDPDNSFANPFALTSNVATVNVTIDPVNDKPAGNPLEAMTGESQPVDITLVGTDQETPAGNLTYSIASLPSHGSVTLAGNVATYTPGGGWFGEDTFTYLIHDTGDPPGSGSTVSDPVTVTVRVVPAYTATNGHIVTLGSVTVQLRGPGIATVYPSHYFESQPEISQIVLNGTTQSSLLMITALWARVGDVTVHGSLGKFITRSVELVGDLVVDGTLLVGMLGNLSGGNSIRIGASSNPRFATTLILADVADVSIDSDTPIAVLRANQWVNTDGVTDTINVPWIGTMIITRDFQADLVLSGVGALRQTLAHARIGKNLTNAVWDITGAAGVINVIGLVNNWTLLSGSGGLGSVQSLMLGNVNTANVTVNGSLGVVWATRWLAGSLNSDTLQWLLVLGNPRAGVRGDFSPDFSLDGPGGSSRLRYTLGVAKILGNVGSSDPQDPAVWNLTGDVGTLLVLGSVQNWNLNVNSSLHYLNLGAADNVNIVVSGDISVLVAQQFIGGSIQARALQVMKIIGNPRSGIAANFSGDMTLTKTSGPYTVALAYVLGGITGGTWNVSGNVGKVIAGSTASAWTGTFTGNVAFFQTIRNLSGTLTARTINVMFVGRDLYNATVRLTAPVNPANPRSYGMSIMVVRSWMRKSDFRSAGKVGRAVIGAMDESNLYLGVKDSVVSLPLYRDHFLDVSNTLLPSLGSLTVTGIRGQPKSFIGSNVAAWSLGVINLVNTDVYNNGTPFGLAGHSLTMLLRRDGRTVYRWPNPSEPSGPAPDHDFVVRLF